MANEEVVAELAAVRECLAHVADSIGNLIPKGELERASTAVTEDNRRWRRSVALLILGGPVLALMNAGIWLQTRHNEALFKADVRQGVSCLLGDEASHRRDQRRFETAISQKLGVTIELGPETRVPESDLNVLTGQCGEVLRRFADLTLGAGFPNEAGGKP